MQTSGEEAGSRFLPSTYIFACCSHAYLTHALFVSCSHRGLIILVRGLLKDRGRG
jgi:hypothetical protein